MTPELWTLDIRDDQVIAERADGNKRMVIMSATPPVIRTFLGPPLPPRITDDEAKVLLFRRPS